MQLSLMWHMRILPMKMLELFAGTRTVTKAFEALGYETFSIELDKAHPDIDWYTSILDITAQDILDRFGKPDVIWASPPCTTFSPLGFRWHRRTVNGEALPTSQDAVIGDMLMQHTRKLIEELNPTYFYIENPKSYLRNAGFFDGIPRFTVTYCQYGERNMKPTDIWTNHPNPNFKPPCKYGAPCHTYATTGMRTGTQSVNSSKAKSKIPDLLAKHVAEVSTYDTN